MKCRPLSLVTAAGVLLTLVSPQADAATSGASERRLPSQHFAIGTRDRLLTNGDLAWTPTTGVPFDSVYQYASGTGPGTPGDAHVSTIVAFAKKAQRHHLLPV